MSMWETVSIPLGIKQSIDTIFAGVLIGGIDRSNDENTSLLQSKLTVRKYTEAKFLGTFQQNVFNNTYAVFYDILTKVKATVFTVDQIEAIIDNNRDIVLDTPFINKADFVGGDRNIPNDDDIINAMISMLKTEYSRLSYKSVTEDEFDSACNMYIDWYKDTFMFYTCNNMTMIMSNTGLDVKLPGKRSRHYQGRDDAQEYYAINMSILDSLNGTGGSKVTSVDADWLRADLEKSKKQDEKSIFNTGLKEIDSVWGPLRRGNMLGVLGKTKGGKTRFCSFEVARALKRGLNVAVFIMEGTADEWTSAITASLIADKSYESVKRKGEGSLLRISSSDILRNTFRDKRTLSSIISSAKMDLATNPKYGHLEILEGTRYVETFQDELKAQYKKSPFDMVVIDSLVNIQSNTIKNKPEAISRAYLETKQTVEYGLPIPALAICTAQMKQTTIDELRRNPDADIEVTAGGESAETIRTPDYTLGLFSTKEELSADIMKMFSVAQRHTGAFENFAARGYMDCCYFLSEEDTLG